MCMAQTCAGALFYAVDTGRFLFLHRTQSKHSRVWGLAGGTAESGETAWQACEREIAEEIGSQTIEKTIPLERFRSRDGEFEYHTYVCVVEREFRPVLNHEHDGYAWVGYGVWPRPLHYGLRNTLIKHINDTKIDLILTVYSSNNEPNV